MNFRQFPCGQTGAALFGLAILTIGPGLISTALAAPARTGVKAGAAKPASVRATAPGAGATGAGAMATALAIRHEAGGKIAKFYQGRGFQPVWVSKGRIGADAQAFVRYLDEAELDGLKPSRYGPDKLREAISQANRGGPEDVATAEVALSSAFARYVRDMRKAGNVGMTYVGKGLAPAKLADDAILRVAALNDFGAYVGGMGWMSPHYLRMRDLLRAAENKGADERTIEVVRLNLERARVLPSAAVRHIVVDAATARLWYYQNGRMVGTMRVVVGAEKTQTPMLAGYINWAIFNPYWNIPDYLTRDNVARKILSGRTLKSMNMEVLSDWSANPQVVDPATIDWRAVQDGKVDLRIRELPGPANSMGKVKYLFPNDEGIYLHDTPNRDLLVKEDRHLSNGCIRLDDAEKLGRWMMGKAFDRHGKGPEQPVVMPAPVPVYLTYLTATATRSGVALLTDVYGRDRR